VYDAHELADLFPSMEEPAFQDLVRDIRTNGLVEPITLFKGKVLDGRNRQRACAEAGVEPRYVEFQGDDPRAFVISKNINRRHLTDNARTLVWASLMEFERGGQIGNQNAAKNESFQKKDSFFTCGEVSRRSGIPTMTLQRAKAINTSGDPDLIAAVKAGRETITGGAKKVWKAKEAAKPKSSPEPAGESPTPGEARPNPPSPEFGEDDSEMSGSLQQAEKLALELIASGLELPANDSEIERRTGCPTRVAPKVAGFLRGFLAASKITPEAVESMIREKLWDSVIREARWKIEFAEQYHPAYGLPKIPLRQEEYNTLLKCLHPDMIARFNDPDLTARFTEALAIVKKLKLTIMKPDTFQGQPKTVLPSLDEFLAKRKAEASERAKKGAATRKAGKHTAEASA